MNDKHTADAIAALTGLHGVAEKERIETGVRQAAALWQKTDGSGEDFTAFCQNYFFTGENLDGLLVRMEEKMELLAGHFSALTRGLMKEIHEDTGPLHSVDSLFASYNPEAHLLEDLFKTKLAFTILLNFPCPSLEECLATGSNWNRKRWAQARLAQAAAFRVPPEASQRISAARAEAENYINTYNINMDCVTDKDGKSLFRPGLRLISHWGLRDELKSLYSNAADNLPAQRAIQKIMERIVSQEIPQAAVNSSSGKWEPFANTIDGMPAKAEPDMRYRRLLDIFKAYKAEDKYYPALPTLIDRRFKMNRELPEAEVEEMFAAILRAPVGGQVAALIEKRLGRALEPLDLWYDGFKARGAMDPAKLDELTTGRYPDAEAFRKDIPAILQKLGFDRETALFLGERIAVDPARGAGHAYPPAMRTEKAHLRTRISLKGMNYNGFNIAMHELGHCVEEVFSLYRMDHTLLGGVPNTAFTEGFAFIFQARDMEVLGLGKKDELAEHLEALGNFWATREIAGVALVDMKVWNWLYAHPRATPAQLKKAVIKIAREIWNTYNAPLFKAKDSTLLGIYSHMICYGMYLPDYPLGHIIAFQVENYFRTHELPGEMERMCRLGRLTPAEWMRQATGERISPHPLISAAEQAVAKLAEKGLRM